MKGRRKNFKRGAQESTDRKNFVDSLKGLRKIVTENIAGSFDAKRELEQYEKDFHSDSGECIYAAAQVWWEIFGGSRCTYIESNIPAWLTCAARTGDSSLFHAIARLYYEGGVIERDWEKAVEYLHAAVELKNAAAMVNLARLYRRGDGVSKDETKAFELYRRAAELGNKTAMIELYVRYRDGDGVQKNQTLAERWYEQIKSKLPDVADEIYETGYHYAINAAVQLKYRDGRIFKSYDEERARHYFQIALEYYWDAVRYGRRDAYTDIGQFYLCGYGVKKDLARAIEYFDKAGSWYILAKSYLEGEDVPQDLERAIYYFSKGGEWFYVGEIYRKAGDIAEAEKWYAKYFETYSANDLREVSIIAKMYRDGEEYESAPFDEEFEGPKLPRDTARALEYFKLADDYLAIGGIYEGEKNFAAAAESYRRCIEGCDDSEEEQFVAEIARKCLKDLEEKE